MSLFASSFQDPSAGPSTLSAPTLGKQHKDGNKKRKRAAAPFTAAGGTGANRLKITESNFHKVMKKVEGGEVKEKGGDGLNMGDIGKGKKEKVKVEMKGKGARGRALANATSGSSPVVARKVKELPVKAKGGEGKKKQVVVEESEDDEDVEDHGGRLANGKPAPAELPLPHDMPKSGKKGKAGEDGLTDMQRQMQAKLEGARFRLVIHLRAVAVIWDLS